MDPHTALAELQTPQELAILALSEPYLTSGEASSGKSNKRSSNTSSNSARENATPAILSADLAHYQELFSKLRFAYVEEGTKERFLRAITAEQPEFVDASENAELEERLREDKVALKERKQEVREIVKVLEEQGRQLASRMYTIDRTIERVLTVCRRLRKHSTPNHTARFVTLRDRQSGVYDPPTKADSRTKIRQPGPIIAASANTGAAERA